MYKNCIGNRTSVIYFPQLSFKVRNVKVPQSAVYNNLRFYYDKCFCEIDQQKFYISVLPHHSQFFRNIMFELQFSPY